MDQKAKNQREWENPENWRGGPFGVYVSDRDTRLWVPKRRPRMGFTVNLGNPAGRWVLAGIVGFVLTVVAVAITMD